MAIIAISDLKAHLNVTFDEDDALIAAKIASAEAFVDKFLPETLAEMDVVPENLKEAVRQLAAFFYENREGAAVPEGVWQLLNQHREFAF